MELAGTSRSPIIEYGVCSLTREGEGESGDLHLVKTFDGGALVAVVDGLGHGQEAATAARLAVATLEGAEQVSIISLVRRCHEKLQGTRGVVMSLAFLNGADDTITWLGVGNVEGVLLRAEAPVSSDYEAILLRGGVVGYRLPPLRAGVIPINRGDTLIFATDGIGSGFVGEVSLQEAPQRIADRICSKCAKSTDDALVLVVRYLGHEPA